MAACRRRGDARWKRSTTEREGDAAQGRCRRPAQVEKVIDVTISREIERSSGGSPSSPRSARPRPSSACSARCRGIITASSRSPSAGTPASPWSRPVSRRPCSRPRLACWPAIPTVVFTTISSTAKWRTAARPKALPRVRGDPVAPIDRAREGDPWEQAYNQVGAFGSRRARRRSSQPNGEINVTPIVDVMLVLLIIFMVTAPMLHRRTYTWRPRPTCTHRSICPRPRQARSRSRTGARHHHRSRRQGVPAEQRISFDELVPN